MADSKEKAPHRFECAWKGGRTRKGPDTFRLQMRRAQEQLQQLRANRHQIKSVQKALATAKRSAQWLKESSSRDTEFDEFIAQMGPIDTLRWCFSLPSRAKDLSLSGLQASVAALRKITQATFASKFRVGLSVLTVMAYPTPMMVVMELVKLLAPLIDEMCGAASSALGSLETLLSNVATWLGGAPIQPGLGGAGFQAQMGPAEGSVPGWAQAVPLGAGFAAVIAAIAVGRSVTNTTEMGNTFSRWAQYGRSLQGLEFGINSVLKFAGWIMELVTSFISNYYTRGELSLFSERDELKKRGIDASAYVREVNDLCDPTKADAIFNSKETEQRLYDLMRQSKAVMETLPSFVGSPNTTAILRDSNTKLWKFAADFANSDSSRTNRQTPFVISICGPPGCGKSNITDLLARSIADTRNGCKMTFNHDNLIYSRSSEKHWNNYRGQDIVIIDDFAQTRSAQPADSEYLQFIHAISSVRWQPEQASIQDKGRPMTSKLFITTTNTPYPMPAEVQDFKAVWRRRNILVEMSKDKDGQYSFQRLNPLQNTANTIGQPFGITQLLATCVKEINQWQSSADDLLAQEILIIPDDMRAEMVVPYGSITENFDPWRVEGATWFATRNLPKYTEPQQPDWEEEQVWQPSSLYDLAFKQLSESLKNPDHSIYGRPTCMHNPFCECGCTSDYYNPVTCNQTGLHGGCLSNKWLVDARPSGEAGDMVQLFAYQGDMEYYDPACCEDCDGMHKHIPVWKTLCPSYQHFLLEPMERLHWHPLHQNLSQEEHYEKYPDHLWCYLEWFDTMDKNHVAGSDPFDWTLISSVKTFEWKHPEPDRDFYEWFNEDELFHPYLPFGHPLRCQTLLPLFDEVTPEIKARDFTEWIETCGRYLTPEDLQTEIDAGWDAILESSIYDCYWLRRKQPTWQAQMDEEDRLLFSPDHVEYPLHQETYCKSWWEETLAGPLESLINFSRNCLFGLAEIKDKILRILSSISHTSMFQGFWGKTYALINPAVHAAKKFSHFLLVGGVAILTELALLMAARKIAGLFGFGRREDFQCENCAHPISIVTEGKFYNDQQGRKAMLRKSVHMRPEAKFYNDTSKRAVHLKKNVAMRVEGCSDPATLQMIDTRLINAVFRIKGPRGSVQGLAVGGQLVLVPYHCIESHAASGSESEIFEIIRTGGKKSQHSIVFADVVRLPDVEGNPADLCMIKLDLGFQPSRSILKHICKSDDFQYLERAEGELVKFTPHGSVYVRDANLRLHTKTAKYTLDHDESVQYEIGTKVMHNAQTELGDCGAPIVAYHTRMSGHITSMHVAGARGQSLGFGAPLVRETIEEIIETHFPDSPLDGFTIPEFYQAQELTAQEILDRAAVYPQPEMELLGLTTPAFVQPCPRRTDFVRSPLYNLAFEAVKEPSVLSVQDSRIAPENRDMTPLQRGIMKYSGERVTPFPAPVLERAKSIAFAHLKTMPFNYIEPRLLTEDEMFNGNTMARITPIDLASSPGLPYTKLRPPMSRGKHFLFLKREDGTIKGINEEIEAGRLLKTELASCEEQLAGRDRMVLHPSYSNLKDELLKTAKVRAGDTRTFECSPLHINLLWRKYFGAFMAANAQNAARYPSSVGINPLGCDWTILAERLGKWGGNVIAGDYKKWDGKLLASVMEAACAIINAWYADGEVNARIRRRLIETAVHTIQIVANTITVKDQGLPSGIPVTADLNSLCNFLYIICAFIILADKAGHQYLDHEVMKWLECAFYGDDHVIAVHPSCQHFFNATEVQRLFNSMGLVYTDVHKNTTDCAPFEKLWETTYLKRQFIESPDAPGRFLAPLDMTSITSPVNYIRRDGDPVASTLQNCETALREVYMHGRTKFLDTAQKINDAIEKRISFQHTSEAGAWRLLPVSYEQYHQRWLEEAFAR